CTPGRALRALPAHGKEYQQGYELVNDWRRLQSSDSHLRRMCQQCAVHNATARRTAHRMMAKKKRKGSDKKQKASRSRQGKQRQERRD
ncbi:hypothetical protein HaLaN_16806, partial [Haematococcus lacustris]